MPQTPIYNPALAGNPQSATSQSYPNGNPVAGYNPPGARNTDAAVPLRRSGPVIHNYTCDGPAPGNLAFRWIYGSRVAARNRDPRIQVVQYNEDTFFLRQNVCVHWEAPFTYLLFGNRGALLIDTGATPEALYYPLRETVDAIIARWCQARGRGRIALTVVMTSGEDAAQNQGLGQFAGRPDSVLAPTVFDTIDLGDRAISVIQTPGAHKDGLTFYDPYCDFLFTGDLLFPGKINIGNDRDYVASLERLASFAASHSVKWVVGGHIEMMFVPGKSYPRFATFKPYERRLEMVPALLDEAVRCAREVQGREMMLIRPDFVLLNGVSPDQRTQVWPEGVPNIDAPRSF